MNDVMLKARRPYILRAFYEWLVDNGLTPHIVVDATLPSVDVPFEYVQDGQIVLNIAPQAVGNLDLGNEHVFFNARFGGRPLSITVPLYAVMAIYARENGAGTMFEVEPAYEAMLADEDAVDVEDEISSQLASDVDGEGDDEPPKKPKGPPTLTVIK